MYSFKFIFKSFTEGIISGISKQEGVKNVFVRGLGDRYNVTKLNGFILPSEDPSFKKKYPEVTNHILNLEGNIRAAGIHAAALIISPIDLSIG
jgi:DNA polymerase III alpha subunit